MAHDILGTALHDYRGKKSVSPLLLHTSYGDIEEMPVAVFFRKPADFPVLERIALTHCYGKVLDIGAGAGSHALYLQQQGIAVQAMDISPGAAEVMRQRGVKQVTTVDFFQYTDGEYDTLLFLMNGIGLAGDLNGLRKLLQHCRQLLAPGGQLLFDSSDIAYLYADESVPKPADYYGQIGYQYEYRGKKGTPFSWLYIDQHTMHSLAGEAGWTMQVLYEDDNDQYLARLVSH